MRASQVGCETPVRVCREFRCVGPAFHGADWFPGTDTARLAKINMTENGLGEPATKFLPWQSAPKYAHAQQGDGHDLGMILFSSPMVGSVQLPFRTGGLLLGTAFPKHKTTGRFFKVTASRCAEDSESRGNPGSGLVLDPALNAYVPVG
jgi:hypothetical protein